EHLGDAAFAVFLTDGSSAPDFPLIMPTEHQLAQRLQALATTDPLDNPLIPRLAFGSNGWAVGPEKSATGNALFAFDSHDALGLPNLFYEVHLFFEDAAQIRGWSAPGLPGVINGYNEHLAWGFTNIGDTQDLFLEQQHPDNPELLLSDGQWYTPRRRSVTIAVKGAEPIQVDVVTTRNGRLISTSPPVALRWTALERDDIALDSLLKLNRAHDRVSLNAALDAFPAPTLNATWADNRGNIGFRTAGWLPIRGAGDGLFPQPGHRSDRRWQGLVPAKDMPRLFNPESGYVAAANARVQAPGSTVLVSADNAAPYRIQRIQQVLESRQSLTVADMVALQTDWFDSQASALLPLMLPALTDSTPDSSAAKATALLQAWQRRPVASPDSAAALIFQRWYIALAKGVFADKLGNELMQDLLSSGYPLNHALDALLRVEDDVHWWQGNKGSIIQAALDDAISDIAAATGITEPMAWRLDQLQQVGLPHELGSAIPLIGSMFNVAPVRTGGSTSTVGRANYRYDRPNEVRHGATVRVVADMAPVPSVASVIPGGQSGHLLSPHYADQFAAWTAGELLPLKSSAGDVGEPAIRLSPAPP
ncbi:MAG: penicillin acylase family protein, partial [Pseudomonadota bacterium]